MNIRLEHITKKFKTTIAVNDLTVTIPQGELVCLLGPSGCGKSTTLGMIAGLEKPTAGEIYFDDIPMSEVEPEHRDIGMVFQNYALYPHMTVLENIMFPLKMRHIQKTQRHARAIEAAKLMQICELEHRKPGQLSGGQQQRVAIARALVKEPKILLMDEPFSNLDARLRIELRDDIRTLQKRLGITTVFVTHDQEEAMSISDKILLLHDGILQQYAAPMEMYCTPTNRFVAGFLGNPPMNFIACTKINNTMVVKNEKDWFFPLDKLSTAIRMDLDSYVVGIRPEDLSVHEKSHDFIAEVTAVQTLGKEIYLKLRKGEHTLTACLNWNHSYGIGEKVPITVKRIHIFPEEYMGGDK